MASDGFKRLLFGLILFVLFASLILSLAIDFGNNYDRSVDEIGGGALNLTLFEESADSIEGSASSYRERFEGGEIEDVDDPSGVFSIVTDMITMVTTPFGLISQVASNLLGVPSIMINVMLGLLSISLILAIWSVLRKGD